MKALKAGQSYCVEIRLNNAEFLVRGSPFSSRGGIRLGGIRAIGSEKAIQEAVQLAKESDGLYRVFSVRCLPLTSTSSVVVLVVGLNHECVEATDDISSVLTFVAGGRVKDSTVQIWSMRH